MSFQVRSAWVMAIATLGLGGYYFGLLIGISRHTGALATPDVPLLVTGVVLLIIAVIVGHIAIAIFNPKEANAALDERERDIERRGIALSAQFSWVGSVLSLVVYLATGSGVWLFYAILGSLILSQASSYLTTIYYHYRGTL